MGLCGNLNIIFMREIIFSDMTRKTPKHYLTRYVIFIVCNLIDNSSQPMSEQEFLQLLGKKKEMKVCNLFMIINKLPAIKRSIKMC